MKHWTDDDVESEFDDTVMESFWRAFTNLVSLETIHLDLNKQIGKSFN